MVRWNFHNIHSRNLGLSCRNGMYRTCPSSGLVARSNRDIGFMNLRFLYMYTSLVVWMRYDLPVLGSRKTITPRMSHLDVLVLYTLTCVPMGIGGRSFADLSYSVLVCMAFVLFLSVALLMFSCGTNPDDCNLNY